MQNTKQVSGEKVLIVREDEASMLLHALYQYVKKTHYDLSDDEQACEIRWMLDLQKKLTLYLDGQLDKDVIILP